MPNPTTDTFFPISITDNSVICFQLLGGCMAQGTKEHHSFCHKTTYLWHRNTQQDTSHTGTYQRGQSHCQLLLEDRHCWEDVGWMILLGTRTWNNTAGWSGPMVQCKREANSEPSQYNVINSTAGKKGSHICCNSENSSTNASHIRGIYQKL